MLLGALHFTFTLWQSMRNSSGAHLTSQGVSVLQSCRTHGNFAGEIEMSSEEYVWLTGRTLWKAASWCAVTHATPEMKMIKQWLESKLIMTLTGSQALRWLLHFRGMGKGYGFLWVIKHSAPCPVLIMYGFLINCTGIGHLNWLDLTNRYCQTFGKKVLGKIKLPAVGLYPWSPLNIQMFEFGIDHGCSV